MARLARVCALLVVAACLVPAAAHASATNITTIAGGGGSAFGYGLQPATLDTAIPTPGFVSDLRLAGTNAVATLLQDNTCMLLGAYANADADVGSSVNWLVPLMGVHDDCGAPNSAYGPILASSLKLKNPCCAARLSDNNGTILVASSLAGRIEAMQIGNSVAQTQAGGVRPSTCGTTVSPPAPPDDVSQLSAQFCTIVALDALGDGSQYAIGETGRTVYEPGWLYWVDLPNDKVHLVAVIGVAGLAYAPNGDLYVTDGLAGIKRITSFTDGSPAITQIAGNSSEVKGFKDGAALTARFNEPGAVTAGYDGSIYVADTQNCRIRRISDASGSGAVSTVAGGDLCGDSGDGGPATGARLNFPAGVDMSPRGLLIADTGNDRIRLIDRTTILSAPSGTIADSTPDFTFASLDSPPHLQCKLDDQAPVACDPSWTLPAAADGAHTLRVWEGGPPADPVPSVATFTIDTTPPSGVSQSAPAPDVTIESASPSFSWTQGQDATGIDHYELWVDGRKDSDVPLSACSAGVCSAPPAKPLSEAAHRWQVRAVDTLGNSGATGERSLTVSTAPSAVLVVSPNPALVGRTVTFNGSGSSDTSGISRYEWDLDGDGSYEVDSGATSSVSRSYDAPANVVVSLRVTDGSGKTATAGSSLKITDPAGAQGLLGISINSGAQFTNDPKVKLLVKAPSTATTVLASNDGGFLAPATFPVSSSIDWTLDSSGPERLPKTVYVRFLLGPIVSETYTDDIILDQIPPVVDSAALVPSGPAPAASAARVKARTYVVRVKAKDSNSGVGKLQVTANKRTPGPLLAYRATVRVKAGARPKFVRARDRAGNFSAWKKLR